MAELAWKTTTMLQEFMNKAEEFINTDETIIGLLEFRQKQGKAFEKKHKEP